MPLTRVKDGEGYKRSGKVISEACIYRTIDHFRQREGTVEKHLSLSKRIRKSMAFTCLRGIERTINVEDQKQSD